MSEPRMQETQQSSFPLLMNWIGAILSLLLTFGLIYWAVAVGTRNPNDIPIVKAIEGPARIEPEDQQGNVAENQGLSVNQIASDESDAPLADQVALAPESPDLTDETLLQAPVETEIEQATSIEDVIVALQAEENAETLGGLSRSPVPQQRPSGLRVTLPVVSNVAVNETNSVEEPVTVPVGTRLVQLGAYASNQIAIKEWDILIRKHGDLLDGKQRYIQVADTSSGRFYRLRALGFTDATESKAFCVALKARGAQCFPVTAR